MRKNLGIPALVFIAAVLIWPTLQAQTVESVTLSEAVPIDGITVGPDGDLYAASSYAGDSLYKIGPNGEVTTIAKGLAGPIHVVVDGSGNFYLSNYMDKGSISKVTPDGKVSTFAEVPRGPAGMAFDKAGNLYVAIYGNEVGDGDAIYRITPAGEASVFVAGHGLEAPVGLTFDDNGNLYAVNAKSGAILRVTAAGEVSVFAQIPKGPGFFSSGHLVFGNGRFYASGNSNQKVFEVSMAGEVKVLAGTGERNVADGPASSAQFVIPNGMALSKDGKILFVVAGGGGKNIRVRKINL